MSVDLLNLYDTATLPQHFTSLDRHMLEHYCNKHIDALGKAFIPMPDLERIFNCDPKSILRSRARLVTEGALDQVTKGFPGQCSEFAVNRQWLLDHQQVTSQLPVSRNRSPRSNQQVTAQPPTGNPKVTDRSLESYPIQEHKNTKTQQQVGYSQQLQNLINTRLTRDKTFTLTKEQTQLCSELEYKGTSFKAIAEAWESVPVAEQNSPGGWLLSVLRKLVACEPDWSMDNLPPKCADQDCGEDRTLSYRYEIPGGKGSTTNQCPVCNPYALRRRSA